MTRDEAVFRIQATCPGLSRADVTGILSCSSDELVALVESYRHDSALATLSAWAAFFKCLDACAIECVELAPIPGPLKTVVLQVFNLAEGAL